MSERGTVMPEDDESRLRRLILIERLSECYGFLESGKASGGWYLNLLRAVIRNTVCYGLSPKCQLMEMMMESNPELFNALRPFIDMGGYYGAVWQKTKLPPLGTNDFGEAIHV